ncbi:hypothetical protein EZV77_07820 [Burkholderia thailandensis]|nr:hypothetical protein A8H32_00150 [Burkholderia thailandensis]PJO69570.1 hypothetical protein CWD92_25890 [Burkholderia thailandensis]PNE76255.1 hypothetical protein A8H37_32850 [Burkholderia thailandensis]TBW66130.1 hypothetical protein EZV77_07820 [Burkholderia thailandensis]TGB31483.1 hypothetical protein C6946_22785 [Burkholderia thailandensis]
MRTALAGGFVIAWTSTRAARAFGRKREKSAATGPVLRGRGRLRASRPDAAQRNSRARRLARSRCA